jgi:hypothetical protein
MEPPEFMCLVAQLSAAKTTRRVGEEPCDIVFCKTVETQPHSISQHLPQTQGRSGVSTLWLGVVLLPEHYTLPSLSR